MIRRIALRFVIKLAELNRVDRMNLPERQSLKVLRVVSRWIISSLSLSGAGNVTAVEEQLPSDLYRMRLEKLGVVRRVEQIPRGWTIMRNNFSDDRVAHLSLLWIFGEGNVNVVVSAAEQIALHALAVAGRQGIVFVDI